MAIEIDGTERIHASQERVWEALNDPAILQACIPGCEELDQSTPTDMSAVVRLKMGPIKARFSGAITLENINAPESYSIVGEGKGGIAGFAKGRAHVRLAAESPEVTVLTYEVVADVGGKIAQLGSRLIVSTTRKLSGEFFSSFNAALSNS